MGSENNLRVEAEPGRRPAEPNHSRPLRFLGARGQSPVRVAASVALWLAIGLAVLRSLQPVLHAPFQGWNSARLATSAAMVRGYDLYSLPGEGPLLGNPYGPIFAFFYIPVALIPTPALAVSLGTLLTVLVYFLPAGWILSIESRTRPLMASALTFFCLFTYQSDVLRGPASGIHPDALALAASTVACALVYTEERRRELPRLLASAFATIVAIGAKQVTAPVSLAIAAYLWTAEGAATARRYLLAVAGLGVVTLGMILCVTDLRAMIHNTITVPFSHPWQGGGGSASLLHAIRDLGSRALPFLATLAACTGMVTGGRRSPRAWISRSGHLMIAAVAILCVPTSLLGRVKYGGSLNTLSYTMYFAVLGAVLALLRAEREAETRVFGISLRHVVAAVLLIAALGSALRQLPTFAELPRLVRDLPQNPETTAYAFARAHPQQLYLPLNALTTLMADGKAYHTSVGIEDSTLAGFPINAFEFQAHLPRDLRYVLVHRTVFLERYALDFLPAFQERIQLPELPGWTVLVKHGGP